MKCERSTSSLISHLKSQHEVTQQTVVETDSGQHEGSPDAATSHDVDEDHVEEEVPPLERKRLTPGKRKRQLQVDTYFKTKRYTLRGDIQRLICLSNVSFNQIVADDTHRRLLMSSHPSDDPPPRSAATIRKQLAGDSPRLRSDLRARLSAIRDQGL